jgi:hypothetical protein
MEIDKATLIARQIAINVLECTGFAGESCAAIVIVVDGVQQKFCNAMNSKMCIHNISHHMNSGLTNQSMLNLK